MTDREQAILNQIKEQLKEVERTAAELEQGRTILLSAERYYELLEIEKLGVVKGYEMRAKARKEAFEEAFNYLYELVLSAEEGCEITVTSSDIKKIALEKYGVKVRE